ncbi:protein O-glucosyltransferase 2-like [Gigantopelta aegis]|uniref:protein O-glucosyltransferase 2-like n=1 Tax=Gigantopelta aegis TaxID=1735272 RepID=UPI001B888054|nr:protein O-glucosyltransferase 2-like [Gigantopelta aegis]
MRPIDHLCGVIFACFICTVVLIKVGVASEDRIVSPKKTRVWGPGLKSDFFVPVRYFYIHAVDESGEKFIESVGEKAFSVSTYSSDGSRVRIWTQVLDRHDGSYIVRFRPYETTTSLIIDVLYGGKHVAKSPYTLKGPVYHEKCSCPQPDIGQFYKQLDCPKSYQQIKQDLGIFKKIDMKKVAKEAVKRFNNAGAHSICHYKVINNKIYRKTYGQHVGFKMFVDNILVSIVKKVKLPNVEFIVNLGDWPLEKKKLSENPLPILSWCGSEDTRDIVMPTYDITEATLEMMGRVSLDMFSVQANTGPPWSEKSDVAFWRGRDSRQERLDLVVMSRNHPETIDAALTNMFFFKKEPEKYGELVKHISFFDFFKYKYQINVDGTVAAYRLPYLFGGNSLVLKQDSHYYEHFYHHLKPYEHYIPFRHNLSDLMEKVQWARDHDKEAQEIAKAAQMWVRQNLNPADIFCYHVKLFHEYSKLLKNKVEVDKSFEEVEIAKDSESQCDCKPYKKVKGHDEL